MPLSSTQLAQLKADQTKVQTAVTNHKNAALVAKVTTDIDALVPDSVTPPPPPAPLVFSPPSQESLTVGTPFTLTLSASGGTAPYTFTSTGLPAGLSLTGGVISGVPTSSGSTAKVTCRDSGTQSAVVSIVFAVATVAPPPPPPPPPPTNGLPWQAGSDSVQALGSYPLSQTQPQQHWTHIQSAHANNTFTPGQPLTFSIDNAHFPVAATQWEVTDHTGTVISTGNISGSSFTVPAISKLGWFRIRLIGPVVDPAIGNAYGAANFTIVEPDGIFPAIGAWGTGGLPDDFQFASTRMGIRANYDCGGIRYPFSDASSNWVNEANQFAADIAASKTGGWQSIPADPGRPTRMDSVEFVNFKGAAADVAAVTQVAKILGTTVAYEFYNEPNNDFSVSAYFPIHQAGVAAVQAGCPTAKIIGPGTVTANEASLSWIDQFLALSPHLDGISFHPYNCFIGDAWLGDQCMSALTVIIAKHGLSALPLWVTENGGDLCTHYGPYTPRTQLAHSITRSIQQDRWGCAFERQEYFYDSSHGFWDQPSWLLNSQVDVPGGTDPNPILPAMRVRSQQTRGKVFSAELNLGSAGDYLKAYQYSGSGHLLILWTAGTASLPVTLSANPDLQVVDVFGNGLNVIDGTLNVSELPCYASSSTPITVLDVDGGLMTATNIAPTGKASVPANASQTNVARINDGKLYSPYLFNVDIGSSGDPYNDSAHVLPFQAVITFPSPVECDRLGLFTGVPWHQLCAALGFTVEAQVNGAWVELLAAPYANGTTTAIPFVDYGSGCNMELHYDGERVFPVRFTPTTAAEWRITITSATAGDYPDMSTISKVLGYQGSPPHATIVDLRLYAS